MFSAWNWHTGHPWCCCFSYCKCGHNDCMLDFQPTSQSCWPGSRIIKTMRLNSFMVFFFLYAVAIKAENQSNLDLINRKEHVYFWAGLNQTSLQMEATLAEFISEQKYFNLIYIQLSQASSRAEPRKHTSWSPEEESETDFKVTQIPTPSVVAQSPPQRPFLQRNSYTWCETSDLPT